MGGGQQGRPEGGRGGGGGGRGERKTRRGAKKGQGQDVGVASIGLRDMFERMAQPPGGDCHALSLCGGSTLQSQCARVRLEEWYPTYPFVQHGAVNLDLSIVQPECNRAQLLRICQFFL